MLASALASLGMTRMRAVYWHQHIDLSSLKRQLFGHSSEGGPEILPRLLKTYGCFLAELSIPIQCLA